MEKMVNQKETSTVVKEVGEPVSPKEITEGPSFCRENQQDAELQSAASLLELGGSTTQAAQYDEKPNHSFLDILSDVALQGATIDKPSGLRDGPGAHDILCGRGRGFFSHEGNRRMLEIVKKNKERYMEAPTKTRKTEIVKAVTGEILECGCRFLKRVDSSSDWRELDATEALRKVAHCLREEKLSSPDSSVEGSSEGNELAGRTTELQDDHLHVKTRASGRNPGELYGSSYNTKGDLGEEGGNADPSENTIASRPADEIPSEMDMLRVAAMRRSMADLDALTPAERAIFASGRMGGHQGGLMPSDPNQLQYAASARHPWPNLPPDGAGLGNGGGAHGGIVMGEPRPQDILFGVDPAFQFHSGNAALRHLIQSSVGFNPTTTEQKLMISKGLLSRLVMSGARFLTKQSAAPQGLWYRITDVEAEELIFRCLCDEERSLQVVVDKARMEAVMSSKLRNMRGLSATEHTILSHGTVGTIEERNVERGKVENRDQDSTSDSEDELPDRHETKNNLPTTQDRQESGAKSPEPPVASRLSSTATVSNSESGKRAQEARGNVPGPGYHDVVCGRGRGNFRHPGNRRLLRLFQEFKRPYSEASKAGKSIIAKNIVSDIKSKGGRFLKRNVDLSWLVLSDKDAFRKVSHGIRDIPKGRRSQASPLAEMSFYQKAEEEERANRLAALNQAVSAGPRNEAVPPNPSGFLNGPMRSNPAGPKNGPTLPLGHPAMQVGLGNRPFRALAAGPGNRETRPNHSPSAAVGSVVGSIKEARKEEAWQHDTHDVPIALGFPKHSAASTQPTALDVVCGRGKGHFSHPGNRRMLNLIHQKKARYSLASKMGKGNIAREIFDEIQANGGRFLKRKEDSSIWEEVDEKEALKKVCHGIRDTICNYKSKDKLSNDAAEIEASKEAGCEDLSGEALIKKRQLDAALPRTEQQDAFRSVRQRLPDPAFAGANMRGYDSYLLGGFSGRVAAAAAAEAANNRLPLEMLLRAQQASCGPQGSMQGMRGLTPEEAMLLRLYRQG